MYLFLRLNLPWGGGFTQKVMFTVKGGGSEPSAGEKGKESMGPYRKESERGWGEGKYKEIGPEESTRGFSWKKSTRGWG